MFITANQIDTKKDSSKPALSSDSSVQDNKQKQNETKGGWSDAASLME